MGFPDFREKGKEKGYEGVEPHTLESLRSGLRL